MSDDSYKTVIRYYKKGYLSYTGTVSEIHHHYRNFILFNTKSGKTKDVLFIDRVHTVKKYPYVPYTPSSDYFLTTEGEYSYLFFTNNLFFEDREKQNIPYKYAYSHYVYTLDAANNIIATQNIWNTVKEKLFLTDISHPRYADKVILGGMVKLDERPKLMKNSLHGVELIHGTYKLE